MNQLFQHDLFWIIVLPMLDIKSRKNVGLTSSVNERSLTKRGRGLWCNGTPKETIRFKSVLRCYFHSQIRYYRLRRLKNTIMRGCIHMVTDYDTLLQSKNAEIQSLTEQMYARYHTIGELQNILPTIRELSFPTGHSSIYITLIFRPRSLTIKLTPGAVVRSMRVETRDSGSNVWKAVYTVKTCQFTHSKPRLWIPRRWHRPGQPGNVRIRVRDIFQL